MADGGDNVFVYMGGEQVVPGDVTHVIIDRSVNIIPARAFRRRELLAYVETHDDLERIGLLAFSNCISLREINLLGVREVEDAAFYFCSALTDVEFGNKLDTIGQEAFKYCDSLQKIKMVSVRAIEEEAFDNCTQLTEAEFGCNLETIEQDAFYTCPNLRHIAIPLKDEIFPLDPTQHRCDQFDDCPNLTTVDLVGIEGIHKTISSLLLESWRTEINIEIDRINQVLPNSHDFEKTDLIRQWVRSVFSRMEYYKAEHNRLLKEHMTQLELALWKAKLDEKEEENYSIQKVQAGIDGTRKEKRITSGANIVIKNVLPFLRLESPQWS